MHCPLISHLIINFSFVLAFYLRFSLKTSHYNPVNAKQCKIAAQVVCYCVFFKATCQIIKYSSHFTIITEFFCSFNRDFVREELQYGYEGAVYLDSLAFNRFVSAMTSESSYKLTSLDAACSYIHYFCLHFFFLHSPGLNSTAIYLLPADFYSLQA